MGDPRLRLITLSALGLLLSAVPLVVVAMIRW